MDRNPILPIDPARFRAIMRSLVSGVTVITTCRQGRLHGMTATAFSSVCADPPTVLIVLNRSTRTHPLVSESKRFAVNLLTSKQVALGHRFAGKHESPFDGIDHALTGHGIPVLSGALAALECETIQEVDVGTHTIFIGRVLNGVQSDAAPLAYHDGGYTAIGGSTQ